MTVGELFVAFGIRVDKSSIQNAKDAIKSVQQAASGLVSVTRSVIGGVRSMLGIAEHSAEAASHFVSLSQAMGMTIEQTQAWDYLAQQSGSNIKELSVGVSMFLSNLRKYERGAGGKELAYSMREIGLNAADARLALSGPEGLQRVLLHVADNLHAMGNTGETGALASALFGRRSGRAILADMSRGADGIRELQDHFRKLGATLSDKDALTLRGLGNSINDAKIAFNGLINSALVHVAPLITDLTERFIAFINVPENRQRVLEIFSDIIRGIAKLAPLAADALVALGNVIGWLGDHATLVEAVVIAIIAVKAALLGISVTRGLLALVATFNALKTAALGAADAEALAATRSAAGAAVNASAGIELGAAGAATATTAKATSGVTTGASALSGVLLPVLAAYTGVQALRSQFGDDDRFSTLAEKVKATQAAGGDVTSMLLGAGNMPWDRVNAASDGQRAVTVVNNVENTINVKSPAEAKQVSDQFIQEHTDNGMRHAHASLGSNY